MRDVFKSFVSFSLAQTKAKHKLSSLWQKNKQLKTTFDILVAYRGIYVHDLWVLENPEHAIPPYRPCL